MEGLPLPAAAKAIMSISRIAVAGDFSGSRAEEGVVASFLLLVRASAALSSAENCYGTISTNFDYGATFLPVHIPNLVLWSFQRFWELLSYLSLKCFSAWVNQEIRLIWSGNKVTNYAFLFFQEGPGFCWLFPPNSTKPFF